MDVLALLRSKNRCLERFLALSETFRERSRAGGEAWCDLQSLNDFQDNRDASLKAIELYDRKIQEAVDVLPSHMRQVPQLVDAVRSALERKEELVKRILEADLEVISKIEDVKNRLLKDLNGTRRSREVLSKFKSTWIPRSGEELDKEV